MAITAMIIGCSGTVLTSEEAAFIREADPWGLILFARNIDNPHQLKTLTAAFRDIVGRTDAPVLIDQEGGRVQRMGPPHWRKYPAASAFGVLYDVDSVKALATIRQISRLMADDLHQMGINVDCLPVLDVPKPEAHQIIGDRAYGVTPQRVAILARAALAGLCEGGVLGVVKHIPGHGRATADSHVALPVVETEIEELNRCDFMPFAALADAPMAMTAHVIYTALDPDLPATLSKDVIGTTIRDTIGFDGLLMTDDLGMHALSGDFETRAKKAIEAGCDIALHCSGDLAEAAAVAKGSGDLTGRALARADAALATLKAPVEFDRELAVATLKGLVKA